MPHQTTNASLENDHIRFTVSRASNTWSLTDKRADVTWGNVDRPGHWIARLQGPPTPLVLSAVQQHEDAISCAFQNADLSIVFRLLGDALHVYLVPAPGDGTLDHVLVEPLPEVLPRRGR